jgi:D-alanyl-lipoteichoic acid acyltransferase DltB (MBOAT superfamily)
VFKFTNPLLLITGPIALFIKRGGQKSLKKRINYYLPFVLVGVFFYLIVAAPLTSFLFLIEKIDLVSVLFFAIIFEIFVYANFCGLSLIVYGVFGMLGYRIPLNFKQPFSSSNVLDFWKGWHASLSTVLKILFYTPLRRHFSHFIALSGVFIASALWHGITINFLIWGSFHAIVFWISLILLRHNIKFLPMIILIFGVIIGRLIFADSNTDRLLEKLMFSYDGIGVFSALQNVPNTTKASLLLGVGLISIEFFFQRNRYVRKRNYKHLRSPIALALLVVIGIILIKNTGDDYAVYGQR